MPQVFPVIDLAATGRNIQRLRQQKGLTVRDLQNWFNFEEPRAIYKWQSGQSLPTVDNLFALSVLLEIPIEEILIPKQSLHSVTEPQENTCGSKLFYRTEVKLLRSVLAKIARCIADSLFYFSLPRLNCLLNFVTIPRIL